MPNAQPHTDRQLLHPARYPTATLCVLSVMLITQGKWDLYAIQFSGMAPAGGTAGVASVLVSGIVDTTEARQRCSSAMWPSASVMCSPSWVLIVDCSRVQGRCRCTPLRRPATTLRAPGAPRRWTLAAERLSLHPSRAARASWCVDSRGAMRMYVNTAADPHRSTRAIVCSGRPALDIACAPVTLSACPE